VAVSRLPDTTINAAEARDGIVITGRAETGSTVTVNGVAAIVAADGTYTATFRRPACRRRMARHGQRRDHRNAAGNTATATQTLTLDRGTQVAITGVEGGETRSDRG
jgi:hypothetical protein